MALLIHDPRDVEKIPKRTPITESYWQRGCNDAKTGRPEKWPSKGGGFDRRNVGYSNGYAFGRKAGVAGSRMDNYRVSTDMRGHTVVEAHMACINGLSAWVMVADLGKEHLEDQMFGGFDRDAIGQKIVAALGVEAVPVRQQFVVASIKHRAGKVVLETPHLEDVRPAIESGQRVVLVPVGVAVPLHQTFCKDTPP